MTRGLVALLATIAGLPAVADPRGATDERALAFVAELHGDGVTAEREVRGATIAEPVARFDWLVEGSTVRVGAGSSAVLILFSGEKLGMGPGSTGRVSRRGLLDREGAIEKLPATSPLPRVTPPAGTSDGAAAVDLSGEGLRLYPSGGARSLDDATVLRFGHDARLGPFRVRIETEGGRKVYETTTVDRELALPPGVLAPGKDYRWSVVAGGGIDLEVAAEATFSTLSKEELRLRAALRELVPADDVLLAAGPSADAAATFLYLAKVDRDLGLHWEWLETVRRALAASFPCPHPASLAVRLREPCEPPPIRPELLGAG